jgi:hypothetical protein
VADESHWWPWISLAIAVFIVLVIVVGMLFGY